MDQTRRDAPADDKAAALSVASSSFVGATDGRGEASSASRAADLVLAINHGKFMTLQPEHLLIEGEVQKSSESGGICGINFGSSGSPITTISLYNVLWAERKDSQLEVTYAATTGKHKLRPATVSVDVSANDDATLTSWVDALFQRAYGQAKRQKRVKVLVNPHAGPGGSESKYKHDAEPLFRAARMTLDVQKTTRSGEAVGIARGIDIDATDAIIACSGDGLPYEIFNGLGERPDARRALNKIAVCQIPCGSGNAMACTLYGGPHVSEAALGIIKGIDTPIDLVSLTQGDTRTLSFLSQAAGMLAEADLGTESMRWMGAMRFEVGVVLRLIKQSAYPCDLAIKVEREDKGEIKRAYKQYMQQQKGATEAAPAPVDEGDLGLPPLVNGTVNDPLPEDWDQIKYDNLGTFYCGNMAWMAPDTVFFPASLPDDGLMDLVTFDSNVPLITGLSMVAGGMGDGGDFFDHPLVNYRKVSAFRLTPRDQKDGYISIDGEKVPFAPFQAEVHRRLGKVYAPKKGYICKGPKGWESS